MIRILIADDHDIVRRELEAVLGREHDFIIIAEARNGAEAIQLMQKLKPDILVLDLMMTGINGLEITRQVKRKSHNTGIVILSRHQNEDYIQQAFLAGAAAYVLKESPLDELIQAIREVADGGSYLSSQLSQKTLKDLLPKIQTKL